MRGHLGGLAARGGRGGGVAPAWRDTGQARLLRRGQPRHRKCPPREAALGVEGRVAERVRGPPPPWSGPPEAPGGHMVGGSRHPPARGQQVLEGASGSLELRGVEEAGGPDPDHPR